MARYFVLSTAIAVAWAAATVASMTYGVYYYWPDFVHANYGFPLTFATHTLSTLIGPVNTWNLDLGSLAADLAFWSLGMAVILLIVEYVRPSRRREILPV